MSSCVELEERARAERELDEVEDAEARERARPIVHGEQSREESGLARESRDGALGEERVARELDEPKRQQRMIAKRARALRAIARARDVERACPLVHIRD